MVWSDGHKYLAPGAQPWAREVMQTVNEVEGQTARTISDITNENKQLTSSVNLLQRQVNAMPVTKIGSSESSVNWVYGPGGDPALKQITSVWFEAPQGKNLVQLWATGYTDVQTTSNDGLQSRMRGWIYVGMEVPGIPGVNNSFSSSRQFRSVAVNIGTSYAFTMYPFMAASFDLNTVHWSGPLTKFGLALVSESDFAGGIDALESSRGLLNVLVSFSGSGEN